MCKRKSMLVLAFLNLDLQFEDDTLGGSQNQKNEKGGSMKRAKQVQ